MSFPPWLVFIACAPAGPAPETTRLVAGGVEATAPPASRHATVYVPVYSSVFVGDGDQTFDLSVMLSVRNVDEAHAVVVDRVRFFDRQGALVHAYVAEPVTLGPLASAETLVAESDRRAGLGGSFLVDWTAGEGVSDPLVEAVMIGSAHGQGISFLSAGRVVRRTDAP